MKVSIGSKNCLEQLLVDGFEFQVPYTAEHPIVIRITEIPEIDQLRKDLAEAQERVNELLTFNTHLNRESSDIAQRAEDTTKRAEAAEAKLKIYRDVIAMNCDPSDAVCEDHAEIMQDCYLEFGKEEQALKQMED